MYKASCEARDNSPTYHYWAGPEKIESNNTCNALMIHVVSYVDKIIFVISADKETIPNPHQLCDDLQESFHIIKASIKSIECQ
uniref:O-acyltransferase WSD1 C-terminal domain-containing protein n=1 Tax=Lactuca sativa TaxID=4236 RepID=A0A9R1UVK5_LACSA|nr:hypothetical protein LSAT_V11C800414150 [Lactuca sativa]